MIYGNRIYAFDQQPIKESEETKIENISVSLECATEKDVELLEFAHDYFLNKEIEVPVTEGANSEYTDAIKEVVNDYRDDIKEARKLFKDGQYAKAKTVYAKAEKDAKDIEKKIEAVKSDDALSAIIGYFIALGVSFVQTILTALTVFIPIIGQIAAIRTTIQAAEEWKKFIKDLKTKDVDAKTLNLYRNKLLAFVKTLEETAKLGQDACDAKAKKK